VLCKPSGKAVTALEGEKYKTALYVKGKTLSMLKFPNGLDLVWLCVAIILAFGLS